MNPTGMRACRRHPKLLSDSSTETALHQSLDMACTAPFPSTKDSIYYLKSMESTRIVAINTVTTLNVQRKSLTYRHSPPTNMSELFSCHEGLKPPGRHLIQGRSKAFINTRQGFKKRASLPMNYRHRSQIQ